MYALAGVTARAVAFENRAPCFSNDARSERFINIDRRDGRKEGKGDDYGSRATGVLERCPRLFRVNASRDSIRFRKQFWKQFIHSRLFIY
jgi:hypothetical protein